MSNKVFDHYPADINPWPEDVPRMRVRAVGFPEGLVLLWDLGGDEVSRKDIPAEPGTAVTAAYAAGYDVVRGAGCACGSRRLRSAKVTGLVVTEPQSPESADTGVPVESPAGR